MHCFCTNHSIWLACLWWDTVINDWDLTQCGEGQNPQLMHPACVWMPDFTLYGLSLNLTTHMQTRAEKRLTRPCQKQASGIVFYRQMRPLSPPPTKQKSWDSLSKVVFTPYWLTFPSRLGRRVVGKNIWGSIVMVHHNQNVACRQKKLSREINQCNLTTVQPDTQAVHPIGFQCCRLELHWRYIIKTGNWENSFLEE